MKNIMVYQSLACVQVSFITSTVRKVIDSSDLALIFKNWGLQECSKKYGSF